MTPAERRLWAQLKQLELPDGHFRRQAPIGPYFADFAHFGARLVIEIDGDQHGHSAGQAHDAVRTAYLEAQGFSILRFWNAEIAENLHGVVDTILARIAQRTTPLPLMPQSQAPGSMPC